MISLAQLLSLQQDVICVLQNPTYRNTHYLLKNLKMALGNGVHGNDRVYCATVPVLINILRYLNELALSLENNTRVDATELQEILAQYKEIV